MKCKWNGDNKLCIPTLEGGKVMPGGVFEMDPESQKLAGVQKLMRDGMIIPCPEAPGPAAAQPAAPEGPPADNPAGASDTGGSADTSGGDGGGGVEKPPVRPGYPGSAKNKPRTK